MSKSLAGRKLHVHFLVWLPMLALTTIVFAVGAWRVGIVSLFIGAAGFALYMLVGLSPKAHGGRK